VARLPAIGNLLGTRMALNEVIAYIGLGAQKAALAPRSFTIATFALCGFANLGSIGMQIGGIGALVPERRNDLAKFGVRAMLAGTMANLISASIAGMFLGQWSRFPNVVEQAVEWIEYGYLLLVLVIFAVATVRSIWKGMFDE
jgi:hypothetical protein